MFKTITQAARYYDIAPIRIHVLLRQGLVPRYLKGRTRPEIMIETSDAEQYFTERPEVLTAWRENYEKTQRSLLQQQKYARI